jgi:hypothetical protein
MAELSPIPSAQRPSDTGYQPLSGYAVAAFGMAGAFVVLLIVLLIAATFVKRSVFFYELLALPIVGLIFAVIGRSRIRNSEGTRTGMRLANSAWWICVLVGTGFGAYMLANEFVLEQKSARFANRFIEELKKGQKQHAFLYLLPPEEIGKAHPDDPSEVFEAAYTASGFPLFKNHEVVRFIVRNGSSTQVESMGVSEVGQIATGFQATHMFRLTTPEGVHYLRVRLVAAEAKKGGELQWRIPIDPVPNFSMKAEKITAYGQLVAELEQEADAYSKQWMQSYMMGHTLLAHLMTTPKAHSDAIETQMQGVLLLGGAPGIGVPFTAGLLPAERGQRETVRAAPYAHVGFEDLAASGFFRRNEKNDALSDEKMAQLRRLWTNPGLRPAGATRNTQMTQIQRDNNVITLTPDAVTVQIPIELTMNVQPTFAVCTLGVVSNDPALLAAIAKIRDGSTDTSQSGVLRTMPPRDWRIAWLRTDMEPSTMAVGPGAPPGAGGP